MRFKQNYILETTYFVIEITQVFSRKPVQLLRQCIIIILLYFLLHVHSLFVEFTRGIDNNIRTDLRNRTRRQKLGINSKIKNKSLTFPSIPTAAKYS